MYSQKISGNFKIEEIIKALKSASQQLRRSADIILRMKNLKYRGSMHDEAVCLDKMIQETITLIKCEIIDFPIAGLAISRSVVEAHGGELLIKTNPHGGVCASFNLSLRNIL